MNVRALSTIVLSCVGLTPLFAVPATASLDEARGPYAIEVLVDGQPIPSFDHRDETWVLGRRGDRYTVRIRNHSGSRVEAVVSVDGRDVIDGKPADPDKRGYLIAAWGELKIDGWRLSQNEAAAFRFAGVAESYAALTGSGRDVGVIGVAIFPERVYVPPPVVWREDRRDHRQSGVERGSSGDTAGAPAAGETEGDGAGARAEKGAPSPYKRERPGLGTAFGERVDSQVQYVAFERASAKPAVVLGVRYNDRKGLIAMGIDVDHRIRDEEELRSSADPFPGRDRGFAEPPPNWRR